MGKTGGYYATFTRAASHLMDDSNPLGFRPWSKFFDKVEKLSGKVKGILIQRSCGILSAPRIVGIRASGKIIDTMWVGSYDDYTYTEEDYKYFAAISNMDFDLILYTGFPLSNMGYLGTPGYKVAVDMAGVNVLSSVFVKLPNIIIEPYPVKALRCGWFKESMPSFCMAQYWRRLVDENSQPAPGTSIIAYNANASGNNYYNESEANYWRARGYDIAMPGELCI